MFSFWNSSSANEVYIRTDCIISVEILQDDLLSQAVKGEIKAFKFHQNLTMVVSDNMYSKYIQNADYSFIEAIQQLSRNRTFRKKHFIAHPLMKDNEIMVAMRGSIILHGQLEEEGRNGILKVLESYYDNLYKRKPE